MPWYLGLPPGSVCPRRVAVYPGGAAANRDPGKGMVQRADQLLAGDRFAFVHRLMHAAGDDLAGMQNVSAKNGKSQAAPVVSPGKGFRVGKLVATGIQCQCFERVSAGQPGDGMFG